MLTNEGYIIIGGNDGADPVYRSQSKHAGTILRFRSSCFEAAASGAETVTGIPIVSCYFATTFKSRVLSISPLPPLVNQNRRSIFDTCVKFDRS